MYFKMTAILNCFVVRRGKSKLHSWNIIMSCVVRAVRGVKWDSQDSGDYHQQDKVPSQEKEKMR